MSDRELGDWLLTTLRMFGATEATAYQIVGLFLQALAAETNPATPFADRK